ncbi:CarD family transcriptional regulator [Microvirga massiliensis]|uniref:CarD family transcriptional regulator n=1 Tax=Microvirga massiliensis TaxID=1033741 RepID=UPI00062BCB10|nr:CarD family transcriptional regulator [Microvirga massiliensis]
MGTGAKDSTTQKFAVGEAVVYPGRGVGRISSIEEQEAAGFKLEVYVISFERENAVVKIPTARAAKQGLRKVSDAEAIEEAFEILTGRARKSRQMWSRRAVELGGRINSGDIIQVAEVIRDLHRSEGEAEASFSERGLYDSAIALLVQEVSASRHITETEAMKLIQQSLGKAPRRGAKAKDEDGEAGDDLSKVA